MAHASHAKTNILTTTPASHAKTNILTTTPTSHAETNILTTTHASHAETNILTTTQASHAESIILTTTHASHAETNILIGPCGSDFFDVGRDRVREWWKMSGSGSGSGRVWEWKNVSGSSRDRKNSRDIICCYCLVIIMACSAWLKMSSLWLCSNSIRTADQGGIHQKLLNIAVWQLLNQLGSEILPRFPFALCRRVAGFDCLEILYSPISAWQLPER